MKSKSNEKILVTSALPYANGPIHIGHLVEYIQTDIFVRFLKLQGKKAIYICASDAHGTPIQVNAEKNNIAPEEFVKKYNIEHQEDLKQFNIKFDKFYTTHSKENQKYAELFYNTLKKKGLIEIKDIEQTYCEKEKRFLPDRYVKGICPNCKAEDQYGDVCEKCGKTHKTTDLINPYCSICNNPATKKTTAHHFFKLSKMEAKLKTFLKNKNLQEEVVNYVNNWIKEGLQDWDITRDAPYFGFNIPGEKDKYLYVWLDAPIGYISSTEKYCQENNEKVEDYWKNKDTKIYQFIGKDIVYFHYLFWPAMLIENDFNLPTDIIVHGWLTVNGEKMSKSRGTFITAKEFLKTNNPEHLRFYYAQTLTKTQTDIDLNIKEFETKVNTELADNLGNFCYRTLKFIEKNDSKISSLDEKFIKEINRYNEEVEQAYTELNYRKAVKLILELSAKGNKYFQESEPWKLEDKKKLNTVLGTCFNILKNLNILIKPILPSFSESLEKQLNLKEQTWEDLKTIIKTHKINTPEVLIQKIEIKQKESFPLDLRVAKIEEVKPHPDADKLYLIKLNLGDHKRQVVAGLKPFYKPDELLNKKIIIVYNLKPAKLRGEMSEGMILAADKDNIVKVLESSQEPGTSIEIEDHENLKEIIKYEEFQKIKLSIINKEVFYNKSKLKSVKVNIEDGATVK